MLAAFAMLGLAKLSSPVERRRKVPASENTQQEREGPAMAAPRTGCGQGRVAGGVQRH